MYFVETLPKAFENCASISQHAWVGCIWAPSSYATQIAWGEISSLEWTQLEAAHTTNNLFSLLLHQDKNLLQHNKNNKN